VVDFSVKLCDLPAYRQAGMFPWLVFTTEPRSAQERHGGYFG